LIRKRRRRSATGAPGLPFEPDDLHKPLGLVNDRARERFAPNARALGAAALVGAVIGALSFLAGEAEHAGEPFAQAKIASAAPESVGAIAKDGQKGGPEDTAQPAQRVASTGPEVESDSGVTVIRQGGGSAPGALVIRVPDAPASIKLAAAPDPRLVERGEFGPLPRRGAAGARPAQV
jgi:hypothetical protein